MSGTAPAERIPAPPRALPATEVLTSRLEWLIRLRWIAAAGSWLFVEAASRLLPLQLELNRLRALLLALALYNLVAWLVLQRQQQPHSDAAERRTLLTAVGAFVLPQVPLNVHYYGARASRAAVFSLTQITIDLFFLALLLHFSGGVENPLWVFFVFHVIFASVLLSVRATYAVATLGTLLLAAVVFGELRGWLPHYPLAGNLRPNAYLQPSLVAAYCFVQALTLFIAAYLASSIASRLRRRELDVLVLSRHLGDKADRLEAAYQELSVAEKAKSQYMRKVAHELRQPLGTVKTALAVALKYAPENMEARTRDLITRAERRAGALAEMTQELLSLSRAQGGAAVATHAPVDFVQIAGKVLQEMQGHAAEQDISLRFEAPVGMPPLPGDAESLGDLLYNLLGNAIRYTPPGGRVVFRARAEEDCLVVEVQDSGIGIADAELARIFDEFYRSPRAREFAPQGSGLGLAIVKAVVEQHRGSIAVESREGQGTLFRVRLPLRPSPQPVHTG